MAELILKVDPVEVRSKADQINAERTKMAALMDEMRQKVAALPNDVWNAASGEAFVEKYQNVTRNINGSLDRLMAHVRNLTDAAARYEQGEAEIKSKVQSLPTNNIF